MRGRGDIAWILAFNGNHVREALVIDEWRRPERSVAGLTRLQQGVCIKHPVGDHHYPMALVGRRPAGLCASYSWYLSSLQ